MSKDIGTPAGGQDEIELIDRRFNHDLLVDSAEQEAARGRWPAISHVLIEPYLVEAFKPHERKATRLKRATLRLGSLAVLLMFVALLGSALHLWTRASASPIETTILNVLIEGLAIVGLLCAVLASRYGPLRRRWLMNRFVAETFRQWHFRLFLDGSTISESTGPGHNGFVQRRQAQFAALLSDLKGTVGQKMDQLTEKGFDSLGGIQKPNLPRHTNARVQLLDAYRILRLDHQREFAVYKLSADDKTFFGLSSHLLVQTTGFLAAMTLVLALASSVSRLFYPTAWVPVVAISLTIAGIAVRAWRDGLALGEERERYQDMRHRLELLTTRWDSAANEDDRFLVAEEIEQTAFEELRSFIRAHERAQFLF